ncbi:efflux ABC transporter, permease protein [Verrucomicrobiia bacterium DG1235]|nr:efflux ABC transporter, permease protein [Verrucomicrobiae bacterium DG1235]
MLNDLHFGLRQLMKSPGFTLITILTLAIGIGANTAIFSLINAYFIRPLPYEDPDRLVTVLYDTGPNSTFDTYATLLQDIEKNSSQFESFAGIGHSNSTGSLSGIETPAMLSGIEVTGSILEVLGLRPTHGQDFTPDHQSATGNDRVVLLSEQAWRKHLNSDPNIIGKSIVLAHVDYTVIGLYDNELVNAWRYWLSVDFMIPAALPKYEYKREQWKYSIIGRLAPKANLNTVQQEIQAIKSQYASKYPEHVRESNVVVETLHQNAFGFLSGDTTVLLAAVGLVLLVACANVANLLFARATARQSEIALRTAIGASGWRIVRLLLCECALLSLAGAAGGLLICLNALPFLSQLIEYSRWPEGDFTIDARVLAFTLIVSLGTGLLFGVFPALKALREDSAKGLSETSRSSTASQGNRLQSTLIVTEIALSVILLVSIGLLLKSATKALRSDRGFSESNAYTFHVVKDLRQKNFDSPWGEPQQIRTRFSKEVIERLEQIPGVENAAMISQPPMDPRGGIWPREFWRDDQPDAQRNYGVPLLSVNGDAFSILDIPLIRGRVFDERDQRLDAHKVAIIDELLAKEKFPDIDPLGQTVHIVGQTFEIIGIVGSIIPGSLAEGKSSIAYVPQIHWPWDTSYLLKTPLSRSEIEREIQEAIKSIDPDQAIGPFESLEQLAEDTLTYRTVLNTLIALFGTIAVFLAGIGIYGLMTYLVEQRHREIGIRLAIGALPQEMISMILKHGMLLAAIGIAIGITFGIAAMQVFTSTMNDLLYQVSPYDPVILATVSLFVLIVTAFACWRPAKSASKVHPSEALQLG